MEQYLSGAAYGAGSPPVAGSNSNYIALGNQSHDSATNEACFSLNGNLDDYTIWDTLLGFGKIRSLYTGASLLGDYNAGVMNGLFGACDAQGSETVGSLDWVYSAGFDTTGRRLGDTWSQVATTTCGWKVKRTVPWGCR